MDSRINSLFLDLDKAIIFIKGFSNKRYKATSEYKDIKVVKHSFADFSATRTSKEYDFEKRIKILAILFLSISIGFLSIIIISGVYLLNVKKQNTFISLYSKQLFLFLLISFGVIAVIFLCMCIFMLSRLALIKRIATLNKIEIVTELLSTWNIGNIRYNGKENKYDVFQIHDLNIVLKKKKIVVETKENYKNTIVLKDKNIHVQFNDNFKNANILKDILNKKNASHFKALNLSFNKNNKSIIETKKQLYVENILLSLFIIYIYYVYSI